MTHYLDYLTWTIFDIFPFVCVLLGFLVFVAGGLYVGGHLFGFLLKQLGSWCMRAWWYLGWKLPRWVRKQTTQSVTVVNVGADEYVVYLDGRFVGTDAVSVPVSLLHELGISYEERRACMRWLRENNHKLPDYLEEITFINEG